MTHNLKYYQQLQANLEELILEEIDDKRIKAYLIDYVYCLIQIVAIRTEIEKYTFVLN